MSRETYEGGNTVQFTFVSSVAPAAAPIFMVTEPFASTVTSITAVESDSTHFYALYTMPNSESKGFIGTWVAQKTFSGSLRDFIKRFTFNVAITD